MNTPEYGEAEYLCYEVVKSVRERLGEDLPKTEFNKQCYIVYKELQEEGIDVELPVYWYEHGIMVDLEYVSSEFLAFETKRWQGGKGRNASLHSDPGIQGFDITHNIAEKVQDKAQDVAHRFRSTFDTRAAKDDTYQKYGNEFVQSLNEARYFIEDLDDIDRVKQEDYVGLEVSMSDYLEEETVAAEIPGEAEDIESDVLTYLDSLVETFPDDQYTHMDGHFREWESIMRQLAMNHMFSQMSNFMNEFWVRFSKGELRLRHNENIPYAKKNKWRKERREEIEKLEETIEHYRKVLLEHRQETNVLERVADEYSQAVRDTFSSLREGNNDIGIEE